MATKRHTMSWIIGVFLFTVGLGQLAAGDISSFINLGFSADSRYFAFAEYGILAADDRSFSNMFIVDVPRNDFVPSGRYSFRSDTVAALGDDGRGAVFNTYNRAIETIRARRVDATLQGRIIYLLINGDEPTPRIDFRDFVTDRRYSVELRQTSRTDAAAFHIALRIDSPDGKTDSYTVGRQGYFRQGVRDYRIARIILAPDERSLVFVVEKMVANSGGENVRYMVETLKLR